MNDDSQGQGHAVAVYETEIGMTQDKNDLGGHVPHGGRDDLEPAVPPELSHDATELVRLIRGKADPSDIAREQQRLKGNQ